MAIEKEILDQLLADRDPSDVFGKDGLLDDLKKALSERILNAELDEHLDVAIDVLAVEVNNEKVEKLEKRLKEILKLENCIALDDALELPSLESLGVASAPE